MTSETKSLDYFCFGTIDLWEFLKSENYRLVGERSGIVVEEKLWKVYNNSRLENGDTKIKLVNNKTNFLLILPKDIRKKLVPKDIQSIIVPRFIEITPLAITFSSWFIGDAGMSPARDPAFFGDRHAMLLRTMKTFEDIFHYPPSDFFLVVQYPLSRFNDMSEKDKADELQRHAVLLSNVVPIEKIVLVHSGKRGKQGKVPTVSAHYNPALYELAVSLAEVLTFKMTHYIKTSFQPTWLRSPINSFRKPVVTLDLKRICENTGYKNAILSNGKLSVWMNRRYPFVIEPYLPIDYENLLWVGAMQAEGTKEKQMEFIASGRELLEIVFNMLKKTFDMSTVDPHYDMLIGENLHNETHTELNVPLEDKFHRPVDLETKGEEKVTQCESQEVKNFFIKQATQSYPIVTEMRFYRLRVDRIGKKSHFRLEINCSSRIAKLVWTLANEMFYNLYNFLNEFTVQREDV